MFAETTAHTCGCGCGCGDVAAAEDLRNSQRHLVGHCASPLPSCRLRQFVDQLVPPAASAAGSARARSSRWRVVVANVSAPGPDILHFAQAPLQSTVMRLAVTIPCTCARMVWLSIEY